MGTITVPDGVNAEKIARELREGKAGEKIQRSVVHAVAPVVLDEEIDITVFDSEHFIHVCEWYDVDECSQCRRASSYSLETTQNSLY